MCCVFELYSILNIYVGKYLRVSLEVIVKRHLRHFSFDINLVSKRTGITCLLLAIS